MFIYYYITIYIPELYICVFTFKNTGQFSILCVVYYDYVPLLRRVKSKLLTLLATRRDFPGDLIYQLGYLTQCLKKRLPYLAHYVIYIACPLYTHA